MPVPGPVVEAAGFKSPSASPTVHGQTPGAQGCSLPPPSRACTRYAPMVRVRCAVSEMCPPEGCRCDDASDSARLCVVPRPMRADAPKTVRAQHAPCTAVKGLARFSSPNRTLWSSSGTPVAGRELALARRRSISFAPTYCIGRSAPRVAFAR